MSAIWLYAFCASSPTRTPATGTALAAEPLPCTAARKLLRLARAGQSQCQGRVSSTVESVSRAAQRTGPRARDSIRGWKSAPVFLPSAMSCDAWLPSRPHGSAWLDGGAGKILQVLGRATGRALARSALDAMTAQIGPGAGCTAIALKPMLSRTAAHCRSAAFATTRRSQRKHCSRVLI